MFKNGVKMNRNSFIYRFAKKLENPTDNIFWKIMNTLFCFVCICYGSIVYKRLKKQYPGKTLIIVPIASAGDLLFLKISFKEMLRYCGIKDYVVIINKCLTKCATTLEYNPVSFQSVLNVGALNMYYHFMADEIEDVIDSYNWTNFQLKQTRSDFNCDYPKFDTDPEKIKSYFKTGENERGKAVILSPYAQTPIVEKLRILPLIFWEKLAESLSGKGYSVYTNCAGSDAEPVIKNTEQLFCKMTEINDVVSFAGNLVVLRSGFVDYSCRADAVNVVLYPTEGFYKRWSTAELGLSEKTIELIYEKVDIENGIDQYVEEISAYFPEVTGYGS